MSTTVKEDMHQTTPGGVTVANLSDLLTWQRPSRQVDMLLKTMEAVKEAEFPHSPANRLDVLGSDSATIVDQGHVWFIAMPLDAKPYFPQFRDKRALQHHYTGDAVPTEQNKRPLELTAKARRAIECHVKRRDLNRGSGDTGPLDSLLTELGAPANAQQAHVEQLRLARNTGQSVFGAQHAARPLSVEGVVGLWLDREENRAWRSLLRVKDRIMRQAAVAPLPRGELAHRIHIPGLLACVSLGTR